MVDVTASFLTEVDERLPGQLDCLLLHGSICWGEFFPASDIDFVAVWKKVPEGHELDELRAAHHAARARHPHVAFDGFHCTAADLTRDPRTLGGRPVFYEGAFDPNGSADVNLVTWHELAERGIAVRGEVPAGVHTDLVGLLAATRHNLDSYWRAQLTRAEDAGADRVGANDDAVAWIGLGAPRLHHLLTTRCLTSKSGAGRYAAGLRDGRWRQISLEALRIRERPETRSLYDEPAARGRDLLELLRCVVEDGTT